MRSTRSISCVSIIKTDIIINRIQYNHYNLNYSLHRKNIVNFAAYDVLTPVRTSIMWLFTADWLIPKLSASSLFFLDVTLPISLIYCHTLNLLFTNYADFYLPSSNLSMFVFDPTLLPSAHSAWNWIGERAPFFTPHASWRLAYATTPNICSTDIHILLLLGYCINMGRQVLWNCINIYMQGKINP